MIRIWWKILRWNKIVSGAVETPPLYKKIAEKRMMKKWTVKDRYGNTVYLTEERWQHILESRPELEPFSELFPETIRSGHRKQDAMIPNEYR